MWVDRWGSELLGVVDLALLGNNLEELIESFGVGVGNCFPHELEYLECN